MNNNHDIHPNIDEKDYPLSNGSVAAASCTTNGDTENEESTEDRSELDSSEIDDVSIHYIKNCRMKRAMKHNCIFSSKQNLVYLKRYKQVS